MHRKHDSMKNNWENTDNELSINVATAYTLKHFKHEYIEMKITHIYLIPPSIMIVVPGNT